MTENKLHELLPWYVNGSLDESEQQAVSAWLETSEQARQELAQLIRLHRQVQGLPALELPADGLLTIRRRIVGKQKAPGFTWRSPHLAWGLVLTGIFLALLWLSVRPGVSLEWSVETGEPSAFLIYRAPKGSTDFRLIKEIGASPGTRQYQFVDAGLVPGIAYTYRVEGVGAGGPPSVSRSISIDPLTVLPGQLAVLFTSLALGFSLALLAQALRLQTHRRQFSF